MTTKNCSGKGECLNQCGHTSDCNEPYHKRDDMTCEFNCQPMKCPNYLVCGDVAPKWYYACHWGTCWDCKNRFGKQRVLEFSEDECPVCLETKTCVNMLNCSHKQCIDCFKRCQYGEKKLRPEFPLPEDKWDDYEEGLLDNHPLIVKWQDDCNKLDHEESYQYNREENLRCCSLCRK